ncbi:MAG TPA: hypothetical protein PLC99_24950 [Verrucomicrobiota bacterium]|nr:hypothetical protein [Verrucomicrobiota bacterium]
MPSMTIRMSKLLHSRVQATSFQDRTSLSETVRLLLEEALAKRGPGCGDPVTMDDLQKLAVKWERLIVAILATEQMVVRCLDPHRSVIPHAGQKAMELAAEMLGTSRPKTAP